MHTKIIFERRKKSLERLCVNVTIIMQCIFEISVVLMSDLFKYVRSGCNGEIFVVTIYFRDRNKEIL